MSNTPTETTTERYIRRQELLAMTGLSYNTITAMEVKGKFPKRRELSARAVGWWLPDVLAWQKNPEGWKPPK